MLLVEWGCKNKVLSLITSLNHACTNLILVYFTLNHLYLTINYTDCISSTEEWAMSNNIFGTNV